MDPEPKGLRSIVLLMTAVVLSGIIGYAVWWIVYQRSLIAPPRESAEDVLSTYLHPVEFLPETPPEQRAKITAAIDKLLAIPDNAPVSDAVLAVAAFGEAAIPRLLDALSSFDVRDGFRSDATRRQAQSVDRALRRVARAGAYVNPAPAPIGSRAEPEGFRFVAQTWFLWWESMRKPGGGAPVK